MALSGTAEVVAVAFVSGAGTAVGSGLVYLGWQLGRLRASLDAIEDRLVRTEEWQDDYDNRVARRLDRR